MSITPAATRPRQTPTQGIAAWLIWGGLGLALAGIAVFFMPYDPLTVASGYIISLTFAGIALFNLGLILGLISLASGHRPGRSLSLALWLPITLIVGALLTLWGGLIILQNLR